MTIDELRSAAAVVRDATEEGENTATRIGQLFLDTVNTLCDVSTNAIKGYVVISSTSDLPTSPTTEQQMKGYLLGTTLYVWVGTGGDTLDGKYQSAQLKGEPGPQGESGVDLGDVAIANNLTTNDDTKVLSARQGYVVGTRMDAAEGDIDTLEGKVAKSYVNERSGRYSIVAGKARIPAYDFGLVDSDKRCTISKVLGVEDLTNAKVMESPKGYQTSFAQAKELQRGTEYLDTGWKGGRYEIGGLLNDEYPYKIFNFRRADDADISQQDSETIANGCHLEFSSVIDFIDKEGGTAKSIFSSSDTEKVETYTKAAIDELVRQAVGFVSKGDGSMTYAGAPINLSRNTFDKVGLNPLMTDGGKARQGGAVYGNYFFQFHTGNSYIQVYSLGAEIKLRQTISLTENVSNHANAGGFGAKYDDSDPFPLLYISSADEYKIYVYRLTGALPNLSIQLHQTITLPPATDLVYIPSVAIDAASNELIVYGYTKNTWSDGTNNKSVVAYFDIPPTSGDQTISVSDEKARYYLPYVYAMQGACVQNGKLFLLWGNVATTQGGGLIVLHKGIIESSLDFAAVGRYEPEAVGIYNDALYVSTQSGRMLKLTFLGLMRYED